MTVLKIVRFRLRPEVETDDFVAADKRVQSAFSYQQPGIIRRTVARGVDGGWVALEQWGDQDAADAAAERWTESPAAADYLRLIDVSSIEVEAYRTLG